MLNKQNTAQKKQKMPENLLKKLERGLGWQIIVFSFSNATKETELSDTFRLFSQASVNLGSMRSLNIVQHHFTRISFSIKITKKLISDIRLNDCDILKRLLMINLISER